MRHSTVEAVRIIEEFQKSHSHKNLTHFLRKSVLNKGFGISDATDYQVNLLEQTFNTGNRTLVMDLLSDMVSRRAMLGWTTHGHTGVDVNLYAYGYGVKELHGSIDNTELGRFLWDALGLEQVAPQDTPSVKGTRMSSRVSKILTDRYFSI